MTSTIAKLIRSGSPQGRRRVTHYLMVLVGLVGSAALVTASSQSIESHVAPELAERLAAQPASASSFRETDASELRSDEPADAGREARILRGVQRLIDELGRQRGIDGSAVSADALGDDNVLLRYERRPPPEMFRAFGGDAIVPLDAVDGAEAVEARVDLESVTTTSLDGRLSVIAVRTREDYAATMLRSAEQPVTLEVEAVGLVARQRTELGERSPAVEISISGETRVARQGDTVSFDGPGVKVVVLSSTNRSEEARSMRDGAAYALRLKVFAIR